MSIAFFRSTPDKKYGPLLVVMGFLVAGILLLSLTAMISTLLIAQRTQGLAAAVNQSGTLRMQSYRIGMALAGGPRGADAQAAAVDSLANELAQRLADPRLTGIIPEAKNDPIRVTYSRVLERWQSDLLPTVRRGETKAYLGQVDNFVDDIHILVALIETRAEVYIERLLTIQMFTLSLTVLAAFLGLMLLQAKVLKPLHSLLELAERVRTGDFSFRTSYVGEDELGRLGHSMNLMSGTLSQLYGQLETRVEIKTRELENSNRSLRLLYRSALSLDGANLSVGILRRVLADLRNELRLKRVRLCLYGLLDQGEAPAQADALDEAAFAAAAGSHQQGVELCLGMDAEAAMAAPFNTPAAAGQDLASRSAVSFAIADQQTRYGVLWVVPEDDRKLSDWQRPVLVSWSRQLATALNLRSRLRESQLLAVHEERSILARELHDSLAQSLSYMKIQTMRLGRMLDDRQDGSAEAVLADLRSGINSAYQHLRELLTSFRLKADEHGLHDALRKAVAECQVQGDIEIAFEYRLPQDLLTPNQEVHVLQIVREALSNVRRHARASRARVQLAESEGLVSIEISDNGVGMGDANASRSHHGLSIMRERATSLGAGLEIDGKGQQGTRVKLSFAPSARPPSVGGVDNNKGGAT